MMDPKYNGVLNTIIYRKEHLDFGSIHILCYTYITRLTTYSIQSTISKKQYFPNPITVSWSEFESHRL